jgi:hypothetical protein
MSYTPQGIDATVKKAEMKWVRVTNPASLAAGQGGYDDAHGYLGIGGGRWLTFNGAGQTIQQSVAAPRVTGGGDSAATTLVNQLMQASYILQVASSILPNGFVLTAGNGISITFSGGLATVAAKAPTATQNGSLLFGTTGGTWTEGFALTNGDGEILVNDDGLILYSEVA